MLVRRSSTRPHWFVALLALGTSGVIGWERPARADEPVAASGAAASPEARRRAATEFRKGEQLFKAARYADAAKAFESALAIAPHAATLWNAAEAHAMAGNAPRAANLYARYRGTGGSESAAELDRRLADLGQKLGRVRLRGRGATQVTIDGQAVDPKLEATYVDVGDHEVAADLVDGSVLRRKVSVAAGAAVTVLLEPETAPSAPSDPRPTDATLAPDPAAGKLAPTWFYVGLGVTAVLGVATAWSALDTRSARDDYKADPAPTQEAYDAGRSKETRTNILLGATVVGAAATAAVGVFFTRWGGSRDHAARLRLEPGCASLELSSRF